MATHSPDVRKEVNYRLDNTIQVKGDLTTLDENVVDIVEQTDSYLVTVEDTELGETYDREIPKDWVESVDLTNDTISYYPPSTPTYTFDVVDSWLEDPDTGEVIEVTDEVKGKINLKFTLEKNSLTDAVLSKDLSQFNDNWYFREQELTDEKKFEDSTGKEVDGQGILGDLSSELTSLPVHFDEGESDDGLKDKDVGINLDKNGSFTGELKLNLKDVSETYKICRLTFGAYSYTWTVSSQTDWESNTESWGDTKAEDGKLQLETTEVYDDFEGQADGSEPDGWTIEDENDGIEIDTQESYEGDGSLLYKDAEHSGSRNIAYKDLGSQKSPPEVSFWYRRNAWQGQTSTDYHIVCFQLGDGTTVFRMRVDAEDSGGGDPLKWTPTDGAAKYFGDHQTWYKVRFYNIDWSSYTFDCEVLSNTENQLASWSGLSFATNSGYFERIYVTQKGWSTEGFRLDYIISPLDVSSGTWTSKIWDTTASNAQQISSFQTTSTIGSNENIDARVGVDTDDDGNIEEWSNWITLDGGDDEDIANQISISKGYQYQIEYKLSVTDSDTPTVDSYTLETFRGTVKVKVDKLKLPEPTYIKEIIENVELLDTPDTSYGAEVFEQKDVFDVSDIKGEIRLGISGEVTLDGTAVDGAKVTAYNKTEGEFYGSVETPVDSATGSYGLELVGKFGDIIYVSVQYDSGDQYYGRLKEIVLEGD